MALPAPPAARHRVVAAAFDDLVAAADRDGAWQAPTPVAGWTARDVVVHLVEWLPGFLAGGAGIELPPGPSELDDAAAAWLAQRRAVQALLDDPATAGRRLTNPHVGELPLDRAIDTFYTTDVFMHTWDLGRALGHDVRLDAEHCAELVAGMRPMEEAMRSSGQFGPAVPVPDDADPQTRLIAFIGRNPAWRPRPAAAPAGRHLRALSGRDSRR